MIELQQFCGKRCVLLVDDSPMDDPRPGHWLGTASVWESGEPYGCNRSQRWHNYVRITESAIVLESPLTVKDEPYSHLHDD